MREEPELTAMYAKETSAERRRRLLNRREDIVVAICIGLFLAVFVIAQLVR